MGAVRWEMLCIGDYSLPVSVIRGIAEGSSFGRGWGALGQSISTRAFPFLGF